MTEKAYPTNTLARGLLVLESLAEICQDHGASLKEIVRASGQNRSNVYRYLSTLSELDWIERDKDTLRYQIGPKFLQLAGASLGQMDVRRIAHSMLRELALQTGLTAHLSVLNGASIVYLDKLESDSPIQMRSRPGMTAPCHSTAMGKAMLSTLSIPDILLLLPERLEPRTQSTLPTREALLQEVMEIRSLGYAMDQEENEPGISCVGAVILGYDDEMIGAISLSGLSQEVTPERLRQLGPRVLELAREISKRMGWRPRMGAVPR